MSAITDREETQKKITFAACGLFIGAIIAVIFGFKFWGFIIVAVIPMILGFKWGCWRTNSTYRQMSKEEFFASRVASQAAMCVAEFTSDPNNRQKIAELQKLSGSDRQKFIENEGWDKLPGQRKAVPGVRQACAKGFQQLLAVK